MHGKRVLLTLLSLLVAAAVILLVAVPRKQIETAEDLSSIAGWRGAEPNSAQAFTFVVISDRTGGHIQGEWAAAVEQVNLLQPDFVVCVGDLIEGYSEDQAELERQWEEFDSLTRKFSAPFFYSPGNHDVSNEIMWEVYRQRHGVNGKSYYSFDYRAYHFVVLDSHTAMKKPSFADEQFIWLAKDLAGAKDSKHVFVFYHHPRWDGTNLWPRFLGLVPAAKTTIFNGHVHQQSYNTDYGMEMYVLSSTASSVGSDLRMFAHVAVNQAKVSVARVPMHEVLPFSFRD